MGLKRKVPPKVMAELVNLPKCMTLSEIGSIYGVSRQRVHQVLQEYKEEHPELFIKITDPAKKEIEKLLEKNMPLKKIAEHFNISINKLKKLMNKYGLKKVFIKEKLDKETLYSLFIEEEKSDSEIAKLYNCSKNTVMKLRYNHGITSDMRPSLKEKLPKDVFIDLYVSQKLPLSRIADLYNTHTQAISKLKREYSL